MIFYIYTLIKYIVANFMRKDGGAKMKINIMRAKKFGPHPLLVNHTHFGAIVHCHAH